MVPLGKSNGRHELLFSPSTRIVLVFPLLLFGRTLLFGGRKPRVRLGRATGRCFSGRGTPGAVGEEQRAVAFRGAEPEVPSGKSNGPLLFGGRKPWFRLGRAPGRTGLSAPCGQYVSVQYVCVCV